MSSICRFKEDPRFEHFLFPDFRFPEQGWLFKWTNRIKGYQRRWFVVSDDFLLYFLHGEAASEAAAQQPPRGWIRLEGSTMYALGDGLTFAVSSAEGETFKMRAADEAERRRWMEALSPCRKASGT